MKKRWKRRIKTGAVILAVMLFFAVPVFFSGPEARALDRIINRVDDPFSGEPIFYIKYDVTSGHTVTKEDKYISGYSLDVNIDAHVGDEVRINCTLGYPDVYEETDNTLVRTYSIYGDAPFDGDTDEKRASTGTVVPIAFTVPDTERFTVTIESKTETDRENSSSGTGTYGVVTVVFHVNTVDYSGGTNTIKETDADTNPGETGLDIPTAIVLGLGGLAAGGAGVAGAIAGSAGSGSGNPEGEDKKKRYQLRVYKNFGDRIARGAKPVRVMARIVEIDAQTGAEKDRPDMSSAIRAGGRGMEVASAGMNGAYQMFSLAVDADSKNTEAFLSLSYAGAGGTFTNNIRFNVVDEMRMTFPQDGSGGGWILETEGSFDAIAGDGETYPVRIYFENATEMPKQMDYQSNDGALSVIFEQDYQHQFTYFAYVRNESAPIMDEDIFVKPKYSKLLITATFEDGTVLNGDITGTLWKEGLSAEVTQAEIENGYAIVNCWTEPGFYGTDEEAKEIYVYPHFELRLAIRTEDGVEIVTPGRDDLTIGELEGMDDRSQSIAKKYPFSIEMEYHSSGFWFHQEMDLFEGNTSCYTTLPLNVVYGEKTYTGDLPLRLKGTFIQKMADKETEYKKLLWVIRRFTVSDAEQEKWFEFAEKQMGDGRVSASALRSTSKHIYYQWQANVEADTEHWLMWADYFDKWANAADWAKWLAARSFAIVAKKYAQVNFGEPAGSIVDGVVTPAAELVLDCIGELTDAWINNHSFDIEKTEYWKKLSDAGDGIAYGIDSGEVMDMFSGESTLSPIAKAGRVVGYVGVYFGVTVIRQYCVKLKDEGESDLPGAIYESFKDLSNNMIKSTIGKLFELWFKPDELGGSKFGDAASKWIEKRFKKEYVDYIYRVSDNLDKSVNLQEVVIGFDAAAKWLDEALGAGLGKLYDNAFDKRWDERLGSFSIHRTSAEGIPGVFMSFQLFKNLYVEIDLGRGLEYLQYSGPLAPFNILSEYLFGKIIGSPTTVEFSKDAPEVKDDEVFSFMKMNKSINNTILGV